MAEKNKPKEYEINSSGEMHYNKDTGKIEATGQSKECFTIDWAKKKLADHERALAEVETEEQNLTESIKALMPLTREEEKIKEVIKKINLHYKSDGIKEKLDSVKQDKVQLNRIVGDLQRCIAEAEPNKSFG